MTGAAGAAGADVPVGDGVARLVAQRREAVVIVGPVEQDARFSGVRGRPEVRSSLVCPLLSRGRLLGVLCASRLQRDERFGPGDLRRATILCQQVAQAVDNARLYGELEARMRALQEAYQRLEEAQAQLVHSEKMAAVGLLASGIAHEMASPLTAILGTLQLLAEDFQDAPEKVAEIGKIEKQARRVAAIVRELLDYSRPASFDPRPVDLGEVIRETRALVDHEMRRRKVEIVEQREGEAPRVQADPKRLVQVFINLAMNAVQAMEGRARARLVFRTGSCPEGAFVEVSDTGPGIPAENVPKLFVPFFTTKAPGQGTGLGLFIVQNIVRQHRGRIEVRGRPGEGATFRVVLPAAPAGPA